MWWANIGMVESAVTCAVEAEPDGVLLGGDFVYSKDPSVEVQVDTVIGLLSRLIESGIPTFAVLGNHDYAGDALEEHCIPVLLNEAVPLDPGAGDRGRQLHIVGVDPEVPGWSTSRPHCGMCPTTRPGSS